MSNKDEKVIYKSPNGMIEICEMLEGDVAGRKKIKVTALKVNADESTWNDNGITWIEQYVQDNIKSIIGAPYVVAWLLTKEEGIPSDHGRMSFNDDGDVQFEGDTVGSIMDAYIEDRTINDVSCKVLTTEGYLYTQRYPEFINWLQEEIPNDIVYGSIEINGKGKDKNIIYANESKNEDGTMKEGRQPKVFDFSGLAILSSAVRPADKFSQVIELNSKNKEGENLGKDNKKLIKKAQKVELNDMNYNDIATLITRAFNLAMHDGNDPYCGYKYYIHRFYPLTGRVVMTSWDESGEYYLTTYSVTNSEVSIGEIVEVEEDWIPVEEDTQVEVNTQLIKDIISKKNSDKKEENKKMENDKVILELNQKLEEKTNKINELQKTVESKDAEINSLKTTVAEKDGKVAETNALLVEANKSLEAEKSDKEKLSVEVNSLKETVAKDEADKAKVEANAYFETEIKKNGFTETELNSLKEIADKGDVKGLKDAETELCAKKFKEIKTSKTETGVEVNSVSTLIRTKEQTEKDIKDKGIPSFFVQK